MKKLFFSLVLLVVMSLPTLATPTYNHLSNPNPIEVFQPHVEVEIIPQGDCVYVFTYVDGSL